MIDPKSVYSSVRRGFMPVTQGLAKGGVTPNMLTATGIALNFGAAVLIVYSKFYFAAAVFVVASVCDLLDGAVARYAGKESEFGAFIDSSTDRISEGITLGALGLYFARVHRLGELAAVFVALVASFLVSYTRARAEALGLECKVGLMSRPERIVVLTAGMIFYKWHGLTIAVYVLAALTSLTVLQRIVHVRRKLRRREKAGV